MADGPYEIVFSVRFETVIRRVKRKSPDLARAIAAHFPKLEREPELGKPLRHVLRTYRRIHIEGSFVLLYEIRGTCVYLIDFDHHDCIYKKYE